MILLTTKADFAQIQTSESPKKKWNIEGLQNEIDGGVGSPGVVSATTGENARQCLTRPGGAGGEQEEVYERE